MSPLSSIGWPSITRQGTWERPVLADFDILDLVVELVLVDVVAHAFRIRAVQAMIEL
jgi:hypothetical protein